jgi:uncharacterized protein with GYD domain
MAYYLYRWQFGSGAAKGMVDKPEDRSAPARALVEAFGGKLHCYYFMFGDYDGMAVVEFPDAGSAAACSMRAASSGGFARFETTPLLTTQEAQAALKKAKTTAVDYRPPGA